MPRCHQHREAFKPDAVGWHEEQRATHCRTGTPSRALLKTEHAGVCKRLGALSQHVREEGERHARRHPAASCVTLGCGWHRCMCRTRIQERLLRSMLRSTTRAPTFLHHQEAFTQNPVPVPRASGATAHTGVGASTLARADAVAQQVSVELGICEVHLHTHRRHMLLYTRTLRRVHLAHHVLCCICDSHGSAPHRARGSDCP